jgi:hypothetical protein
MARCCDCAVQRNEACSACVSGVQRRAAYRAVPAQRSAPLGFSSGSSVACVLHPQPQCCHRRQASRAVRSRRTAVTVTARLPEPELWRRPCRAAPNATRRRRSRPQPAARTRRKRSGWRRRAAPPAAQPALERCTNNAHPAQAVAKSSSQQTVAACRRRAGVPTRKGGARARSRATAGRRCRCFGARARCSVRMCASRSPPAFSSSHSVALAPATRPACAAGSWQRDQVFPPRRPRRALHVGRARASAPDSRSEEQMEVRGAARRLEAAQARSLRLGAAAFWRRALQRALPRLRA